MTHRGSMLRLALFVVAALLPASLLSAPLLSAPALAAPSAQRTYANDAFQATNDNRADRGRVRLDKNACLQRFATRQARRMAAQQRLFHQRLQPIANRCRMRAVGENIGFGFRSGDAVVRAWMRSRSHRGNILKRSYRQLAVAARKSGGDWYVVQVFGRRR